MFSTGCSVIQGSIKKRVRLRPTVGLVLGFFPPCKILAPADLNVDNGGCKKRFTWRLSLRLMVRKAVAPANIANMDRMLSTPYLRFWTAATAAILNRVVPVRIS